jgi:hypothetical protein
MTRTDRLRGFVLDCEEMADQIDRALVGDVAARLWLAGQTDASGAITLSTMAPSWVEIDQEAAE